MWVTPNPELIDVNQRRDHDPGGLQAWSTGPELVDLRWEQVDFRTTSLHVLRVKQGIHSTHPILGDELRTLRRLQREQDPRSLFVFTSERGTPFSNAGFARMIERAGKMAKLPFKPHPHMLRHSCGFALANRGHDTRALQSLPRTSQYPAHGALYRIMADALQEFLARVILIFAWDRTQRSADE
jgi:integrase